MTMPDSPTEQAPSAHQSREWREQESLERELLESREQGTVASEARVATREVTLERSVRYGRVIVGGAILGAVAAALFSVTLPITEGADYTVGQVAGLSAIVGGAIGLGLGGVFSLVLTGLARRRRGIGFATQVDVR